MTPRGGARPGAGGPKKSVDEKARMVAIKLHPRTIERLRLLSELRGESQAQVITHALNMLASDCEKVSEQFLPTQGDE